MQKRNLFLRGFGMRRSQVVWVQRRYHLSEAEAEDIVMFALVHCLGRGATRKRCFAKSCMTSCATSVDAKPVNNPL